MTLETARWDSVIHGHLARLLADDHGAKPLATFDWDNTCITGDIGEAVLEDLGADLVAEYDRRCAIDKHDAYAWCAYQVAGRTAADAEALADRAIDARLANGRMRLRPEIIGLMRALERHGFEIWIVSASEERLVRAFAPRYGIARDRVIGMRLAEEGGVLQPRLDGPNTYRQGKVDAIDLRIGRRPVFAAGDAETDLEMLESAGHRLFLDKSRDPHDRMRQIATDRGWWLQPTWSW
jgi:HAD superfamily phosphoserine phosphatase-like hydrolase